MEQTLAGGWSRNFLAIQIDAEAHARRGKAISNFAASLPSPQSNLVTQTMKDPYIFDFLTLTEPFQERELETELIRHLEKFLLELGQGFAFVGRQYRLDVGDEDFYIDLLFYHLRLRAFVVIDLKKGKFKPEYAVWATKGRVPRKDSGGHAGGKFSPSPRDKKHVAQKPLDVMEWLLAINTGLVVDPFVGSGTTILAADKLGRPYYAAEMSPAIAAVWLERLAEVGTRPRPQS